MGVTGARDTVGTTARILVARVRAVSPESAVCVGLGVSNGRQAAEVAHFADGVIVGSALVRCLLDSPDAAGIASLARLTADLADGVRAHGRLISVRPSAAAVSQLTSRTVVPSFDERT